MTSGSRDIIKAMLAGIILDKGCIRTLENLALDITYTFEADTSAVSIVFLTYTLVMDSPGGNQCASVSKSVELFNSTISKSGGVRATLTGWSRGLHMLKR